MSVLSLVVVLGVLMFACSYSSVVVCCMLLLLRVCVVVGCVVLSVSSS